MSPKVKEALEYVGLILAIPAIIFAAIQYYDSKTLKDRMKELLDEASTKYIGSFPGNIDYIVPVIEKAQRDLIILADFPGYGAYYDPNRYKQYENKILQLRKARPLSRVRMLFYSNAERDKKLRDQFSETDWGSVMRSDWFRDFFGTFHVEAELPSSYNQFISRLLEIHVQYEKVLCNNGVEVEHINQSSVLFFWLGDEDNAVFAINNGNGEDRELSFRTSDGKLIKSFSSTFERLWEDNKKDAYKCRH